MALVLLHRNRGWVSVKPSYSRARVRISSQGWAGVRTCASVHAGVHASVRARGRWRACVSVTGASAASGCSGRCGCAPGTPSQPVPSPGGSRSPSSLPRRPPPSVQGSAPSASPPAAAPARIERRARGARGAPSQLQSDDEPRRGGRGEQVSASAGLGRSEGEGAERARATAGPNVAGLQKRLCSLRQPPDPPGLCPCPSRAGARAPLPSRHPRSGRENKAHSGGGAGLTRAQSVESQRAPPLLHSCPLVLARGLGGPHLGRARGGGVARRCPRGRRRRRAAPEAGRSRPRGGAYRRRCCSLRPRFPGRLGSAPPPWQVGPR